MVDNYNPARETSRRRLLRSREPPKARAEQTQRLARVAVFVFYWDKSRGGLPESPAADKRDFIPKGLAMRRQGACTQPPTTGQSMTYKKSSSRLKAKIEKDRPSRTSHRKRPTRSATGDRLTEAQADGKGLVP